MYLLDERLVLDLLDLVSDNLKIVVAVLLVSLFEDAMKDLESKFDEKVKEYVQDVTEKNEFMQFEQLKDDIEKFKEVKNMFEQFSGDFADEEQEEEDDAEENGESEEDEPEFSDMDELDVRIESERLEQYLEDMVKTAQSFY